MFTVDDSEGIPPLLALQVMHERMSPAVHTSALDTAWGALLATFQAVVLGTAPVAGSLTRDATRVLQTALAVLQDRFAAEAGQAGGAAFTFSESVTAASARVQLLYALALSPTERLHAEYNILTDGLSAPTKHSAPGTASRPASGGASAAARPRLGKPRGGGVARTGSAADFAATGVSLLHILQLLRQRPNDTLAKWTLGEAQQRLQPCAIQVMFVPASGLRRR